MATQEDFKNSFQQIKAYIDKKASETEAKIPAVPDSLPQTYTKKDVTLSASGWVPDSEKVAEVNSTSYSTYINGDYSEFVNEKYTDATKWSLVAEGVTIIASEALISNNTLVVRFKNVGTAKRSFSYTFSNLRIEVYNSAGAGSSAIYWGGNFAYTLTDTDVKLNSEVRFTLDEASGKTAASIGLKPTIAKEDGKLTFTADTQPTADLKGTLEIAETSTEGAAFVVGISPKVPTKTSELTNDSEFITSAALTDYSQEFLTAVQNIFPLGKIEYPFIIPGINDDKAGITFLNRFNFEAGQTYTIDYTVTKTDGTSESRTQDVVATNSSVNVSGATGAMLAFDFREGTGALTVRGGAMVADGFHVVVSSDGGTSFETINGSSASGVEGPSWTQCEIKSIVRKTV